MWGIVSTVTPSHRHTAFCLLQPQQDKPTSQGWLEICRNVASLALTESS